MLVKYKVDYIIPFEDFNYFKLQDQILKDVNKKYPTKSIKEKVETWQKQYAYEEIPFKMFFINDYGEIYHYTELLDDFIEYQKALELKDKLEIDF